jgi:biotin carboxylase
MRTVLVLHPRAISFRDPRIGAGRELLRALGLRVIVAEHELDLDVRRHSDEVVELPPPHEVSAGWRRLRELLDQQRIDAVFAQTEAALLLGSLAARHAGLRGISPAAAPLCTNKYACRSVLRSARAAQPAFALGETTADVRAFAREHGYPLVLKAIASAAQRLVTLVRAPRDVEAAVARVRGGLADSLDVERLLDFARVEPVELGCDPRRQFLIESFASGDPVEVDGLVVGSDARCFGVTEQAHATSPDFFIEGYRFPADRPREETDALEQLSTRALAALGVRDTGFSVELRAGADGARLIEVNGRLGVDEGFGDMFAGVLGVHPVLLAFALALGEPVAWSASARRAALAYRCNYERGEVLSTPSAGELAKSDASVRLDVRAGDELRDALDPRVKPHIAHALAFDARSSGAAYARARALVDALPIRVRRAASGHRRHRGAGHADLPARAGALDRSSG